MSVIQVMSVIKWPLVMTQKGAMNAIVWMVLKEMDSTALVDIYFYLLLLLEIKGIVTVYSG